MQPLPQQISFALEQDASSEATCQLTIKRLRRARMQDCQFEVAQIQDEINAAILGWKHNLTGPMYIGTLKTFR